MAYLLQVCFDNSRRLSRRSYLFGFKGTQFKLLQNDPRKWADLLLTVVSTNDMVTRSRIFSLAAEFVSSMAWEIGSAAAVWEAGGCSWPDTLPLSEARGNILSFREARASNNLYLSFLFYWQVMEVDGGDASAFVEKTFRKHRQKLRVMSSDVSNLRLGSQSLGFYMVNACRNAIAHVTSRRRKTPLELDNLDERVRLYYSVQVIKAFAEVFIRDRLNLAESLYLARPKDGKCAEFVDSEALRSGAFRSPYENIRERPWTQRGLTGRAKGRMFVPTKPGPV
jgi:hypothetical protein